MCRKIFCCWDCCTEHVKKKHPCRKSVCPLCCSARLIVKNFDDEEFFCHVVFHHLPLHCRLCGVIYRNSKDLQSFGACNRAGMTCRLEKSEESNFTLNSPSSLTKTPSGSCPTKNQSSATEGDCNANFIDLISPPEFKRNTSTPMHVSGHGSKTQFVFKTPKSPNISLKTPKLGVQVLKNQRRNESTIEKENNSKETSNKNCLSFSASSDSNYQSFSSKSTSLADRTPLRSILSNRSITMSEISSISSRSSNSGRKMLDAMQELDENARTEDFVTAENVESQRHDSIKRVRFSDKFQVKNEVQSTTDNEELEDMENEIFYEARQSLSELSIPLIDKLSASAVRIIDENESNFEKERKNEDSDELDRPKTQSKFQTLDSENKSPQIVKPTTEASSSSSRVIMMLVVEKNGNVDTSELVPLLDSSLKKLVSSSSEKIANSLEATKPKKESSKSESSVISVDSYMSFSSIERYKTPNSTINVTESDAGTSGGIFASMAHAVKVAFRNFSGKSPKLSHQNNSKATNPRSNFAFSLKIRSLQGVDSQETCPESHWSSLSAYFCDQPLQNPVQHRREFQRVWHRFCRQETPNVLATSTKLFLCDPRTLGILWMTWGARYPRDLEAGTKLGGASQSPEWETTRSFLPQQSLRRCSNDCSNVRSPWTTRF